MIFPKKLWDWETLLWGREKSSKIVRLAAESWEFAGLYVPTKKAIGLSSIQAREEYTQMLMLVLSAPWSFN